MGIFTVQDLNGLLARFSLVRRKAVLYCLETGCTAQRIMVLTWRQALIQAQTDLARDIVRSLPRHMKLDYAFWEYLEGGLAVPLFGLEQEVFDQTGYTLTVLQEVYKGMLWVDPGADAALIAEEIEAVLKSAAQ